MLAGQFRQADSGRNRLRERVFQDQLDISWQIVLDRRKFSDQEENIISSFLFEGGKTFRTISIE